MSFPYKTISTNIDSVNTGSFYDQSDLDNILSGSINDKYFGASEQDVIEFSVFDIDGNLQIWKTLTTTPIYNIVSKTYKDVDQNTLTYNYKQYDGGYLMSFDTILFDTLNDLSSSSVNTANHVVSYNCVRNIGGTPSYPLTIKAISPSRKEIQLITKINDNADDEIQNIVNLELQAFAQKKFLIRDIIPTIVQQLDGYQIYSQSITLIQNNKKLIDVMKTTFGFKNDVDVLNFLNDTYVGFTKPIQGNDNQVFYDVFDGILNYLKNWLYTYYKDIKSASELTKIFEYIINNATQIRLNKINTFYGVNAATQKVIVDFITSVFYDNFVKSIVEQINIDYQNKYFVPYLLGGYAIVNDTQDMDVYVNNIREVNKTKGQGPGVGLGAIFPLTSKYGLRADVKEYLAKLSTESNLFRSEEHTSELQSH